LEKKVYKDMVEQEKNHWWFKARREILEQELTKLDLPANSRILEIGCGTGGNLELLKRFGSVKAMELDEFSLEYVKDTFSIEVKKGYLPNNIPYNEHFDLICMFDVLEHVKEDMLSLDILKGYLSENGMIILTIPAYPYLYGSHDKLLHHYRRYYKSKLIKNIENLNYKVLKSSYFNTLLLPIVVIARVLDIVFPSDKSLGYSTPNKFINNLLYRVFKFEKLILNKYRFRVGASIFLLIKIQ
jgi:SAM-dependent methyltransferase